jgi:quercetin dioxygenase-like cupin family protein
MGNTLPRCPPTGIIFGVTNISPDGHAPMHRTTSADYCVVLEGEIVVGLDSGEKKMVRKGDFILQRERIMSS